MKNFLLDNAKLRVILLSMEIDKALNQLSEIHRHLSKSEVYRGINPIALTAAGVMALLAGCIQYFYFSDMSPRIFVIYWGSVAFINIVVALCFIGYNFIYRENRFDRRKTLNTIGQFFPVIIAGFIITLAISATNKSGISYLPGIWAILFGLGIFSVRPYLDKQFIWVAVFFFIAGCKLLIMAVDNSSLSPWGMSITFSVGMIISSVILYWFDERD